MNKVKAPKHKREIIEAFMGYADGYLSQFIDWNDIMPVVDKIIEIDITPAPNWSGYRIEIVPRGYVKISGFPMPPIFRNVAIDGSLINAVYKAVTAFIQWYNTNHLNKQDK